jgi:hypothetical protein
MFTQQLYRAKRRALAMYNERIADYSRAIETRWSIGARRVEAAREEIRELTELGTLNAMYDHIDNMRIVPFDLRSLGQLAGSSFGSMATLLPLLHFDERLANIFDGISKMLDHL